MSLHGYPKSWPGEEKRGAACHRWAWQRESTQRIPLHTKVL
jgi:hypothetical protein